MGLQDLTGQRFDRLTVIRRAPNGVRGQTQWVCLCDCTPDREIVIQASGMVAGRTHSCGCLRREATGDAARTHGKTGSRAHNSWSHAKNRCTNPKGRSWGNYGGRGITMCLRWSQSFAAFYADMGDPPVGRSIERVNNNGHYSCGKHDLCSDCRGRNLPTNCRWATPLEQGNNTRRNVTLECAGKLATLAQWSRSTGVGYKTLQGRVERGEVGEGAVDPASHEITRFIEGPDGTMLRLCEWAKRTGIAPSTILTRIKDGWSPSLAASTPKTHRFHPASQKH